MSRIRERDTDFSLAVCNLMSYDESFCSVGGAPIFLYLKLVSIVTCTFYRCAFRPLGPVLFYGFLCCTFLYKQYN